jgi:predicted house-cleaning NTP pyrophosphatase (Maf/HAM1 superfamily)
MKKWSLKWYSSSSQTPRHVRQQVCFKPIPEDTVEKLVKEGDVFQCAGGLMIEHPLVTPLITSMIGSEDSVKGLCKDTVLNLLLKAAGLTFQEEESEMFASEEEF